MGIIGTWLIIMGLAIASWQFTVLYDKEIVLGTVVAVEPYGSGGRGGQTYRLVAEFQDRAGQQHRYRAAFGLPATGYQVGDPIRIYFDRRDASECGVVSFGYRFGVAWIVMVLGLSCWMLAGGWQLGNQLIDSLLPLNAASKPFN